MKAKFRFPFRHVPEEAGGTHVYRRLERAFFNLEETAPRVGYWSKRDLAEMSKARSTQGQDVSDLTG